MRRTLKCLAGLFLFVVAWRSALGQNPQTSTAPISSVNAKYVQGTAMGFWVTRATGTTVNLTAGSSFCGSAIQTYSAGTLTLTDNSTNYVYLDTASSCVPAFNTTGFSSTTIPVAKVVASGGTIASNAITDYRMAMSQGSGSGGGAFGITSLNGQTSATQTIVTDGTGSDFGIGSSGGIHTIHLPDAGVSARGAVTTGTQSIAGAKTFKSPVTVDDGTSGSVCMSGLTSGTDCIGVPDVAGTPNRINLPTTTGSAGSFLSTDGGNPQQLSWTLIGPGVNVNGASVLSPNFNGATPAPGSNNKNVTWQVTGGSISAEVPAGTDTVLGLVKTITCTAGQAIAAIASGTGVPACSGSVGFSNPMTTLGDTMYEDATPGAARLAGNTTTIKKYLSQTGTGSASAVPAWAQIAFADLSGSATNSQLPGTGATTVNGQTCTLGSSCTIPLSAVNPQTSTYQVLAADFSNYKVITVASGTFNITLVASGSQPSNGQYIWIANYGSGAVTIVRSGQNINGGTSSLVLAAASATAPTFAKVWSDGTNYFAAALKGTYTTVNGETCSLGSTCTLTLASSDFANQGTTTTVLHGNAAGNPSFGAVANADLVNTATTPNGQTCTLGSTCDVNSGAASHSVALNKGSGAALAGLALAIHQSPIGQTSADPVARTWPDCPDSGGNHINFTQSGDSISCGTTGGTAANVLFSGIQTGTNASATMTVGAGGILNYSTTGEIDFNLGVEGQLGTQVTTFAVPNDGSTGTTIKLLAKVNGSGNAIKSGTSDTAIPVYVTASSSATTGNARLATLGSATCTFDASGGTAGHFVIESTTTAGRCKDGGATAPAGSFIIGVLQTSPSANADGTVLVTSLFGASASGSITINGQTCSLAGSCNVNSGATSHSLALNQGSGSAVTGLTLGAHEVAVGVASADPTNKAVPDCTDTGGNHLNFTQSTDAFSCGTTGAGSNTITKAIDLSSCAPLNGNSFFTVTTLVNHAFAMSYWGFVTGVVGDIHCVIHLPHNINSSPAASVILEFAPTTTASSKTVRLVINDACVNPTSGDLDASLTAGTAQTVNVSGTLWNPFEATFTPSCPTGTSNDDQTYEIDIQRVGTNGGDTYASTLALVAAWMQLVLND